MRSLFKVAPTGIGMVSDRVFTQVNKKLCSMLGYSKEELLGMNSRVIYPTEEEYLRVGVEKYAQIREQGTGTVETVWVKKDGSMINVLLSSAPLHLRASRPSRVTPVRFEGLQGRRWSGAEQLLKNYQ